MPNFTPQPESITALWLVQDQRATTTQNHHETNPFGGGGTDTTELSYRIRENTIGYSLSMVVASGPDSCNPWSEFRTARQVTQNNSQRSSCASVAVHVHAARFSGPFDSVCVEVG